MSAYWLDMKKFNGKRVAAFQLGAGMELPETKMALGTPIYISRIDPLREEPYSGSIVANNPMELHISFEQEVVALDEDFWRVDLGTSDIAYRRMQDAITSMAVPHTGYGSESKIQRNTNLRHVLLKSLLPPEDPVAQLPQDYKSPFCDNQLIQSWVKRYSQPNPQVLEGDPPTNGLNSSQIRAMAMMIGKKICLIQGPPGTGKTNTIVETIKLLKLHFQVPQPILVCTYTNVAVDNLVEGFAKAGVNPVRVGGQARKNLSEHTLDFKAQQHQLAPQVENTLRDMDYIRSDIKTLTSKIAAMHRDARGKLIIDYKELERLQSAKVMKEQRLSSLRSRKYRLDQIILRETVLSADVICTTCITSASRDLDVIDFPVVFLDEASMSTEPASLIPLMKGSLHVALIGDHKQLPPVVTSLEAREKGYSISLFERLIEEKDVPTVMLDTQYRMHPAISHFPALEFYTDLLCDGTVDSRGLVFKQLRPPSSTHLLEDECGLRPSVIFLDHAGNESMKDRSRVNHNEAHIIASIVEDLLLLNGELQGKDIGIIAPYNAQISLLTRLFSTNSKFLMRFREVLGDHRAMQLSNIEIKTVDGFEGREKDVIIFSTVRNNSAGHIGFLADKRRLNVGITRAKRALFVVGSISTLRSSRISSTHGEQDGAESWRRYAQWLKDSKLVLNVGGKNLHRVLYGNLSKVEKTKREIIMGMY